MDDNPKFSKKIEQVAAQNLKAGRDLTIANINQTINLPESSTPDSVPQNIPYSGAAQFVGRSEEAIPLCFKAQKIWEKTIGRKDPFFYQF
jgi:hypothetical protein